MSFIKDQPIRSLPDQNELATLLGGFKFKEKHPTRCYERL